MTKYMISMEWTFDVDDDAAAISKYKRLKRMVFTPSVPEPTIMMMTEHGEAVDVTAHDDGDMRISNAGLDLVMHFEGRHLEAYRCPANVWTIGYGHTGMVDGKSIRPGMFITEEKCIELLREDMENFEKAVKKFVKVELTQQQFDALVSFSFNVGAGALSRSTLLRMLNAGDYSAVPAQLNRWNKGGGRVLAGLVRRRLAEGHMWSHGECKYHFDEV